MARPRDPAPPSPHGLPRVMLVDDHPLWRETLRKVIERQAVGRVVAEVGDGEVAAETVGDVSPDVVVMDLELPGMDGIATTERIMSALPDVKVLFLSSFDDRSRVIHAVKAGASGYLLKTIGASEVADAIRHVADGELVFPPHLAEVLLGELRARDHGSDAAATGPVGGSASEDGPAVFRHAGEFWTLEFDGEVAHLADLRGLRHLARLLAIPGREVLAAELIAVRSASTPSEVAARTAASQDGLRSGTGAGVGAALDETAKRAYRQRLGELQAEIDEADGFGDIGRAGRARAELELLTDELARAVGLGGRDRPIRSDVERARIAVTRGIRRAIRRIDEVHPTLGRHLDRSVRTGTFCCYDPEVPVDWTLS